jgi:hypothetical protein
MDLPHTARSEATDRTARPEEVGMRVAKEINTSVDMAESRARAASAVGLIESVLIE